MSHSHTAHPAELGVGVVGAGRVGTALAAALRRSGHRIVAVSAVSAASLDRVQAILPGTPVRPPQDVVAGADLVLLTVPDDALPALVSGLAATGTELAGRLVMHASGRHGLAVLEPATRRGALPLALHPVMTFTGWPGSRSASPPPSSCARWPRSWSWRWAASRCSSPRRTATSTTPPWR